MTAFEQSAWGTERQELGCRRVQVINPHNLAPKEHLGLVQIGRNECHQGEEFLDQNLHRLFIDQAVPGSGHHHGVEHHALPAKVLDSPTHHLHDLWGVKHANLHRIHPNILGHRLDLLL